MNYERRVFGFLGAGPRLETLLPEGFDFLPECSTPVSNGIGGRSMLFIPTSRDEEIAGSDYDYVATLSDGDGREVLLFKRRELPVVWLMRWQLSNGAIYTHLREEDGADLAEATADGVRLAVVEDESPSVLLSSPLEYAVSTSPGYEERVTFFAQDLGEGISIEFSRPSNLPAGQVAMNRDLGAEAMVRCGSQMGIDIQVNHPTSLATAEEFMQEAVESLREWVGDVPLRMSSYRN